MAAADVKISIPEAIAAEYKALKQKRKHAWMLLRIDGASFALELVKTGPPGAGALAELLRALPPAGGGYIVFDLPIKNSYGGSGSKLFLINWAPASAGRGNVIYAQQRRALDGVFTGVIDAHAATKGDVEALLSPGKAGDDDGDFDPDA